MSIPAPGRAHRLARRARLSAPDDGLGAADPHRPGRRLLGLVLGLSALSIPFLAGTGTVVWARAAAAARRSGHAPEAAGTVLLVGSEGGTTWRLRRERRPRRSSRRRPNRVHVGPLSAWIRRRYTTRRRLLIFAATYGDGDAAGLGPRLSRQDRRGAAARRCPSPCSASATAASPPSAPCRARCARRAGAPAGGAVPPIDRRPPVGRRLPPLGRCLRRGHGRSTLDLGHRWSPARRPQHLTLLDRAATTATRCRRRCRSCASPCPAQPWRRLRDRLGRHGFGGFEAGDLLGITPAGR